MFIQPSCPTVQERNRTVILMMMMMMIVIVIIIMKKTKKKKRKKKTRWGMFALEYRGVGSSCSVALFGSLLGMGMAKSVDLRRRPTTRQCFLMKGAARSPPNTPQEQEVEPHAWKTTSITTIMIPTPTRHSTHRDRMLFFFLSIISAHAPIPIRPAHTTAIGGSTTWKPVWIGPEP